MSKMTTPSLPVKQKPLTFNLFVANKARSNNIMSETLTPHFHPKPEHIEYVDFVSYILLIWLIFVQCGTSNPHLDFQQESGSEKAQN